MLSCGLFRYCCSCCRSSSFTHICSLHQVYVRSRRLILVSVLWGRVSPPPGTGGPRGAVELIASLEADAERMWQPVCREPVRSCYIFTLSKTIGASVSAGPGFGGTESSAVAVGRRRAALDTDTGEKEPHRIYNSITATSPSARGRCWSPHSCFMRKSLYFVSLVCCAVQRHPCVLQQIRALYSLRRTLLSLTWSGGELRISPALMHSV